MEENVVVIVFIEMIVDYTNLIIFLFFNSRKNSLKCWYGMLSLTHYKR